MRKNLTKAISTTLAAAMVVTAGGFAGVQQRQQILPLLQQQLQHLLQHLQHRIWLIQHLVWQVHGSIVQNGQMISQD